MPLFLLSDGRAVNPDHVAQIVRHELKAGGDEEFTAFPLAGPPVNMDRHDARRLASAMGGDATRLGEVRDTDEGDEAPAPLAVGDAVIGNGGNPGAVVALAGTGPYGYVPPSMAAVRFPGGVAIVNASELERR